MSKQLEASGSSMVKARSWADVDNDDFFAQVAQDKPAGSAKAASPTVSWGASSGMAKPERKSATSGGVPWSFPNPVAPSSTSQTRFEGLAPTTRKQNLGSWRR